MMPEEMFPSFKSFRKTHTLCIRFSFSPVTKSARLMAKTIRNIERSRGWCQMECLALVQCCNSRASFCFFFFFFKPQTGLLKKVRGYIFIFSCRPDAWKWMSVFKRERLRSEVITVPAFCPDGKREAFVLNWLRTPQLIGTRRRWPPFDKMRRRSFWFMTGCQMTRSNWSRLFQSSPALPDNESHQKWVSPLSGSCIRLGVRISRG